MNHLLRAASLGSSSLLLSSLCLTTLASAQTVPNDTCATATPISGLGEWFFDINQADSSGFDGGNALACGFAVGDVPPMRDVFFRWTALGDGARQISLCSAMFSSAIDVHLGGDCSAVCIEGNAHGHCGPLSAARVTLNVSAGTEYLIQLGDWGFNDPLPGFWLDVLEAPPGGTLVDEVSFDCTANPSSVGVPVEVRVRLPEWADSGMLNLNPVGAPSGSFGLFLVAPTGVGPAVMQTLGEGILCLGAPVGRYSPTMATALNDPALDSLGTFLPDDAGFLANSSDAVHQGFDIPARLPYSGPPQEILTGDSWSFQFLYRDTDPNGAPTVNLSHMVTLTFL